MLIRPEAVRPGDANFSSCRCTPSSTVHHMLARRGGEAHMNRFRRRNRAASIPVGVGAEGASAIFAWRADLLVRLDDQLSRATDVTLAAIESWTSLDDRPPKDVYLAQAFSEAGLWASEHEPGIHIARWSDDNGTVTVRAWDWDLTRPLAGSDYARTARIRTIPWPSESDRTRGLGSENDSGIAEILSTPAPRAVEPPMTTARASEQVCESRDSTPRGWSRAVVRLGDIRPKSTMRHYRNILVAILVWAVGTIIAIAPGVQLIVIKLIGVVIMLIGVVAFIAVVLNRIRGL